MTMVQDNLPAVAAGAALSSEHHANLVTRGLVAIKSSKEWMLPRDEDELYRRARAVFNRVCRGEDCGLIMYWSGSANPDLLSAFKTFHYLASKQYGKAYYPLSILCGGQDLEQLRQDWIDRRYGKYRYWSAEARELHETRSRHFACLAFESVLSNCEQDDPELWCDLGDMYLYGHGTVKDEAEAERWFRKAADRGCAKAQFMLGLLLSDVDDSLDRTDAEAWLWKAAEQGYADAEFELAGCYEIGYGVLKSREKAVELYRRAAAHKHPRAVACLRELEG